MTNLYNLLGAKLTKQEVLDRKDIGTDAVTGLLLFCWQIKRHLDLLHFSARNICDFRNLSEGKNFLSKILNQNTKIITKELNF